jgi:hypothetical protein
MHLAQVSLAVGIISTGQTTEVILQHGELQSQDYVTGTPGNNSGDHEKSMTLSVIVIEVHLTTGRCHKIHVQHQSRNTTGIRAATQQG